MNRIILTVSLSLFLSFSLMAQTVLLQEGFETDGEGTRYTSSTFSNCTDNDYFVRTNLNPYICSTAGFGNELGNVQGSYFWVSEDITSADNPNGTDAVLTLNALDVTGYSNFTVSMHLAEGRADGTRWESDDKVLIQSSWDGVNYTTIGSFIGDGTEIIGGNLRQDLNLDGVADASGSIVSTTFTPYTFDVAGGGTNLTVRIKLVDHDASEEFAFDQIVIKANAGPPANFAPVLSGNEGASIQYFEGDSPVTISSSIAVNDADDANLVSATVEICAGYDSGEDVLTFSPVAGIAGVFDSGSGQLKFTGSSTLANYQLILRSVQYQNTNTDNPSNQLREICFSVNDGTENSNVVKRSIAVMDVISEAVCLPLVESFETDGEGIRYISNTFTDFPNSDYFYRTNQQPAGHADAVSGIDGSYFWASEDVISAGSGGLDGIIEFAPINIVGYSNFEFALLMGTSNDNGTRWEQTDNIMLQYNIDNNGWNTFGLFQGDDPFGGALRVDMDNSTDTAGGGGPYGATVPNGNVADFSFEIPGTGNQMKVRIVVQQDGGSEELVFDNIRISGDGPGALSCNNMNLYLDETGNASIMEGDLSALTSEICGIDSVIYSAYNFSCSELGANPVEVKVYYNDASTETCTSTVTVMDTSSPTAVCQNITVYLDGAGNASIVAADLDGGSSDNCTFSLSASKTDFNLNDLGDNTVVLTVTDTEMNSSACSAIVTVELIAEDAIWTGAVSSDWHTAENWDIGIVPGAGNNVVIPAGLTNYPTIASAVNCYDLLIESNAIGTGSLVGQENLSVNGTVNIERYTSGAQWHIAASPAPGQTITSFLTENTTIPTKNTDDRGMTDYSELDNNWNPMFTSTQSGNLESGEGFLLRTDADGIVNFTGTLQTGTISPAVTTAGFGWNGIGNPYPSAIAINTGAGAANFIGENIDLLTPANSNLHPSYAAIYVWEQSTEAYTIINLGDAAFYAQSGQGFMARANTGATQLQFTTAMQTHQAAAAFKSGTAIPEINIIAQLENQQSSTKLRFDDRMKTGLDMGYDAGIFKTGFDLYTQLLDDNGVDFGVQWLPNIALDKVEIALGLDSKNAGLVTFSAETMNLPASSHVVLEDRLTHTFTTLSAGEVYSVQVENNSKVKGRFYLHASTATTNISEQGEKGGFSAYTANENIYIKGQVSGKAVATLYDILGRKIHVSQLEPASLNAISTAGIKTGVYVLSIEHERGTFNQKIPVTR